VALGIAEEVFNVKGQRPRSLIIIYEMYCNSYSNSQCTNVCMLLWRTDGCIHSDGMAWIETQLFVTELEDIKCEWLHFGLIYYPSTLIYWQDAQLSQKDRAAGCVIVFAKSRRLYWRRYFTDIIGLSSTTVI